MVIRKSESANIDEIMQIILDARASIGRLGIDQWQYGYPTRDIVIEDIELGRSYVVEDGEVLGTFALIDDGEPTYDKIYRGEWLTEGNNYVAFHRIALAGKARGTGLASKIIEFIADYAKENGDIAFLDLQQVSPFCDIDIMALFGSKISYIKNLINGIHRPIM